MDGVALGFGLGFLVALGLGPMSLLLIRTTLRDGLASGLAVGAGIAVVDAVYAAAAVAGASAVLQIDSVRLVLGCLGAVVLAVLGIRMLRAAARPVTEGARDAGASPRAAFRLSLVGTASNPMTIASWAAIFAAASVATEAAPVPLVVGVGLGSATWVTALACVVAVVRRGVSTRAVRGVDTVAGVGLLGFAAALGYRVVTGW